VADDRVETGDTLFTPRCADVTRGRAQSDRERPPRPL